MKPLIYRILCGFLFLLAAAGLFVQVQGQCRRFVQVGIGYAHVLAIASDGTLWAWGYNASGQLGIGNTDHQNLPVQIGTDHDWKQVRTGEHHSFAVKTNGTLWARGENGNGQLGIGNRIDQYTPVQVGTDTDWDLSCILLNDHNGPNPPIGMALKTNGSLWFWRHSPSEGDFPFEESTGARDWKRASVGLLPGPLSLDCVYAIKTNGTLWIIPVSSLRSAPIQMGTDTDWKTVIAGSGFQLAIKNDGTLWSWGYNAYGQLGNGTIGGDRVDIPTQIGTDRDWKEVAASYGTSYAIKNDGSLWSWGHAGDNRDNGRLGDGTDKDRGVPTKVGRGWSGGGHTSIVAACRTAMVFRSNSSLWGVGSVEGLRRQGGGNTVRYLTQFYQYEFVTGLGLPGDQQKLPSTDLWHYFERDCRLICAVQQTNNWNSTGAIVWVNSMTARVWVDNRVGYSVRRHHQITPAFNPETTTGKVRLFFTQEDFDAFNAVATNTKKLPTRPDDAAGIANLRVEQRSGVSSDGSGSPGSYPGTAQTINPDDYYIRWDATKRWWEVWLQEMIFGGGYWIKTIENPLPVTFGRIAAYTRDGSLFVDWTAEKEINNHHYEIEAGRDGETFKKIGELASRAPNGNSGTAIEYQFQTPVTGLLLGAAGIAALALAIGAGPRRRLLPAAIVVLALLGTAACVKKSGEGLTIGSQKIWVRIAQVDKDGTKQYSRIVQVITGN